MRFLTLNSGKLVEQDQWQQKNAAASRISTGIRGLDGLFGASGLARGAVHELLYRTDSARPMFPAMLLAKAATGLESELPIPPVSLLAGPCALTTRPPEVEPQGVIVVSDPHKQLYPPAAAQLGIPLSHLYLLHPRNKEEELWAISECLASSGVAAVIACLGKLSQVEARRLQLAAERGESLGVFIRPNGPASSIYAAANRLLVTPQPGFAHSQCWKLELVHGQGSQLGKSLILEYNREKHTLHTVDQLAGQQVASQTAIPSRRAIA
jgi:hypothetical protein